MSDIIDRIREWHAKYASTGSGPNAEAIQAGLVDHWWDVDALLAEIDRLQAKDGSDTIEAELP